jgi:hypothetical protein
MTQRRTQIADAERTQRAATEEMEVLPVKDKWWLNIVKTQHGVYTVNAMGRRRCVARFACNALRSPHRVKSCTCRDFAHRIVKLRRAGCPNAHCKLTVAHFATAIFRVLYGKKTLQAGMLTLCAPRTRSERKEAV